MVVTEEEILEIEIEIVLIDLEGALIVEKKDILPVSAHNVHIFLISQLKEQGISETVMEIVMEDIEVVETETEMTVEIEIEDLTSTKMRVEAEAGAEVTKQRSTKREEIHHPDLLAIEVI